jgi:hypothetical protein
VDIPVVSGDKTITTTGLQITGMDKPTAIEAIAKHQGVSIAELFPMNITIEDTFGKVIGSKTYNSYLDFPEKDDICKKTKKNVYYYVRYQSK